MKGVFFDFDGTLFNTLPDITVAINHALAEKGFDNVSEEEARLFVGHGLKNAMRSAALKSSGGNLPESMINEMFISMEKYYSEHPAERTVPYAGVERILLGLKDRGILTGVVSNKELGIVKKILEKYPLALDYVAGVGNGVPLKPNPAMLVNGLRELSLGLDDIIYIGDSEVDRLTAENAGAMYRIVSYGFRTEKELFESGIENTIRTVSDLGLFLDF